MRWHEKSREYDVYFCRSILCHVLTFRGSSLKSQRKCPLCGDVGILAREGSSLDIADRIEENKRRRESETFQEQSSA